MITDAKVLVLFETDLTPKYQFKNLSSIIDSLDVCDFEIDVKTIVSYDIIMFVDSYGNTKLIKNRFGGDGLVTRKGK